ncbi:hypothetical protein TrVE_jg9500 [Triparma verrucosa]|uniref:Protein HGH1 homolog n=2 Tax=Triparma TaxID=722752 RepID=A0A9W7A4D0_9STRA|nr:hypothetical protein TrST_g8446 [Triparma strigata]GMI04011.1 hypothetical protein TrVE_jg9500 [Triparma verrucosa]
MAGMLDVEELAEIVSFLANDRPDVKCEACDAVSAALGGDDALANRQNVATMLEQSVPLLLSKMISTPYPPGLIAGKSINEVWKTRVQYHSLNAASAMVGVGGEMAAEAFLSSGMIGRIGEIVMEHTPAITQLRDMMNDEARDANESERVVDAGVAFLANISRTEAGSSAFLDKESLMTKLITEFVATPPKGFDCFQHVASILMNISQMERGRKIILNKTDAYLAKISPFLLSGTTTRRYGVAGAIRNVCFEKDFSWWLLNEAKIVDTICFPLCGPEGFDIDDKVGMNPEFWLSGIDKKREVDVDIRMLLVEAILLLCACGRRARETLRELQVYAVVKVLDLSEESEEVSNKIDEVVQYLMRDEEGQESNEPVRILDESELTQSKVVKPKQGESYDSID